jgi:hypothetical protein
MQILSNWNFSRILRLILGGIILVEGIRSGEFFFILVGGIFTLMPLFNVGCCNTACAPRNSRFKAPTNDDISYEEVK